MPAIDKLDSKHASDLHEACEASRLYQPYFFTVQVPRNHPGHSDSRLRSSQYNNDTQQLAPTAQIGFTEPRHFSLLQPSSKPDEPTKRKRLY
jgi:hypothetical protein